MKKPKGITERQRAAIVRLLVARFVWREDGDAGARRYAHDCRMIDESVHAGPYEEGSPARFWLDHEHGLPPFYDDEFAGTHAWYVDTFGPAVSRILRVRVYGEPWNAAVTSYYEA